MPEDILKLKTRENLQRSSIIYTQSFFKEGKIEENLPFNFNTFDLFRKKKNLQHYKKHKSIKSFIEKRKRKITEKWKIIG